MYIADEQPLVVGNGVKHTRNSHQIDFRESEFRLKWARFQ